MVLGWASMSGRGYWNTQHIPFDRRFVWSKVFCWRSLPGDRLWMYHHCWLGCWLRYVYRYRSSRIYHSLSKSLVWIICWLWHSGVELLRGSSMNHHRWLLMACETIPITAGPRYYICAPARLVAKAQPTSTTLSHFWLLGSKYEHEMGPKTKTKTYEFTEFSLFLTLSLPRNQSEWY